MEKNAQEYVNSEQSAKALLAPSGHRSRPTKQVISGANQKIVMEPWENQVKNNKDEHVKELIKLSSSIMDQLQTDIQLMKENDANMTQLVLQQMKTNARNRNSMRQRVATCRQINEYLQKNAQEQVAPSKSPSKPHAPICKARDEPKSEQYDVKKELSILQKEIMNDNSKEELERVWTHVSRGFPL